MLNSWVASKQADLSTARHSTGETTVTANTPTTESAGDVQKQTDNKQDSLRDARCKKPLVDSNTKEKGPTPFLGLRQIATQCGLLLSSWAVLTLFQPGGHPVLLFVAIVLSRLHLGWLLCCMFRMVLSSCRNNRSRSSRPTEEQQPVSRYRRLQERCWSRLPLRYWHCAFYLLLLLVAFLAASLVRDDSQEGLQTLQGGGGVSLPPGHAWLGGGLPPLLLNSDSPQHVKIAATAVARGREASDHLVWLLHFASRRQYEKLATWLRALSWWIESAVLQPFSSLLRRAGILASVSGTCNATDAPDMPGDNTGTEFWWVVWFRNAIQTAVRSLPSSAHTFLCGGSRDAGNRDVDVPPAWPDREQQAHIAFDEQESVLEMGHYCLALMLMLVYSLSTVVNRLCLAVPSALRQRLIASGFVIDSGLMSKLMGYVTVGSKSALTAFAVTFVVLSLLCVAATVAFRAIVLLIFVVGKLLGRRSDCVTTASAPNRGENSTSVSWSASGGSKRGAAGLEILAACLTCWVLLLPDREFVMFTWTTLQPLRLSVLSTLLLLRLPSAQVAALLTWPPPLREPALMLQRSQPLKIIDPVAVGSMMGCVLAAAAVHVMWRLAAKLFRYLRKALFPTSVASVDYETPTLGCTRGEWTSRNSSAGSDCQTPNALWQRLQEQSLMVSELQATLKRERRRAELAEESYTKLQKVQFDRLEAQKETLTAKSESIRATDLEKRETKLRTKISTVSSAAGEAWRRQDMVKEEVLLAEEVQQEKTEEALKQKLQNQEKSFYAEQLRDANRLLQDAVNRIEELESKLRETQEEMVQLQQETEKHANQQRHLNAELLVSREGEAKIHALYDKCRASLAATEENCKSLMTERDNICRQLQEALDRCNRLDGETKQTSSIIEKQASDLAAKAAEIDELRKELAEAKNRQQQDAGRPKAVHTEEAHTHEVPQQEDKAPSSSKSDVAALCKAAVYMSKRMMTGLKKKVETDERTVSALKAELRMSSPVTQRLSHASGGGMPSDTSKDTALESNSASRDTVSEYDSRLLKGSTPTGRSATRKKSGTIPIGDRKSALSKEESEALMKALGQSGQCIYLLSTVLENFKLPETTLRAAQKLLDTTKCSSTDSLVLRQALSRSNGCSWTGDAEALAKILAVLRRAWPSEESTERLLQRAGEMTLSPSEQKFILVARIPQVRERLAMLQFLLGLDEQWQTESRRLDKLEGALVSIQQSSVLKRLYRICAEIYNEMRTDFSFEMEPNLKYSEASVHGSLLPHKQYAKIWVNKTKLNSALEKFEVWKDNADFNFGCLANSAKICPPGLKGFSLLHVSLYRAGVASSCGEKAPVAGDAFQGKIPQLLGKEIYGDYSATGAPHGATFSDLDHLTGPAIPRRCSCAVCLDVESINHYLLREWQRQCTMMKHLRMFKMASKMSPSLSVEGVHSQPATQSNDQDSCSSASEGLELAITITKSYCRELKSRQSELADLARSIQQDFTRENPSCTIPQSTLLGAASVGSRSSSPAPSALPEKERPTEMRASKHMTLPAPEAASPPGHAQTDTGWGLEMACQLVKSVHTAVILITQSWDELWNGRNGEAGFVTVDDAHLWPVKQGAGGVSDKTAVTHFSAPSDMSDGSSVSSAVSAAYTAAAAAEAAVKAQEAAARASRQDGTVELKRRDSLGKVIETRQNQDAATDDSRRCSDRSLRCPMLLTYQKSPMQHTKSGRYRQNTELPALSRHITAAGNSIKDSSALERRVPSHSRNLNSGRAAPNSNGVTMASAATTQQHYRFGRYNTQPADLPSSNTIRPTGKLQKGDADPLKSIGPRQLRSACGRRGLLDFASSDRILLRPKREASGASSTTSGAVMGAQGVLQLPDADSGTPPPKGMPNANVDFCSSPSPLLPSSDESSIADGTGDGPLSASPAGSAGTQEPDNASSAAGSGGAS